MLSSTAKYLVFFLPILGAAMWLPWTKWGDAETRRATFLAYIVLTSILFVFGSPPLKYVLLLVAGLLISPKDPEKRAALFVMLILIIPERFPYYVPFPGINYLVILRSDILFQVFMGLPLLLMSRKKVKDGGALLDILFLGFAVFWAMMLLRSPETFTSALRVQVLHVLETVVVYLVLRKWLGSYEGMRAYFTAFFVFLLCLGALAVLSSARNWHFYGEITEFNYLALIRHGGIRLSLQFDPFFLSYMMLTLGVTLYCLRRWLTLPKLAVFAGVLLALFLAQDTKARTAYLLFVAMFGMLIYFRLPSLGLRKFVMFGAIVAVFVLFPIALNYDFGSMEGYNSFDYRQRLFETAMQKLGQNPLFGDSYYYFDPIFDDLVTGEGFVDFTNSYLQIALGSGIIGVSLWTGSHILGIRMAMGNAQKLRAREDERSKEMVVYGELLAIYGIGIMMMGLTSSFISFTFEFAVVQVALCRAYVTAVARELAREEVPSEAKQSLPGAYPQPAE
ncbi:O-antigen ligase family protein [Parvularcula sp. ZS-1/3]|uniref:O-antigen ligase family protein n=1 Tax=Parvularcula mediterranea TaxID=2732508 RepID=A0A7Y3W613_9PROT|nr:O-antigen ligase family protein [Parvularcula mediterranea]NNU17345.1 O-antigen ligase family protein [Parvularcula mediterranea]